MLRRFQLTSDSMLTPAAATIPNMTITPPPRTWIGIVLTSAPTFGIRPAMISRIAPQFNAVVEEVSYSDNEAVVICTVQDLASLETIQKAFNEQESIRAELLSSGARDGKVNGRFRLTTGEGA